MSELLILADDLSGALDSGVQFSRAGFSVAVYPFCERAKDCIPGTAGGENAVSVINTASRHLKPEDARARVLSLKPIMDRFSHVYKKTDSTFRGHIGTELEAFMEARGISLLPFVPAYPELGRTVINGRAMLNGTPLDMTSMASDPLNPVSTSEISKILGEETSLPVRIIAGGSVKMNGGNGIIVFDSSSTEAIDGIGDFLEARGLLKASAGSAGFARILAEKLPRGRDGKQREILIDKNLPLLIVSGSLNPVSAEQIRFAHEAGLPHIELSSSVLAGFSGGDKNLKDAGEKLAALLSGGKTAMISVNGDLPADVHARDLARTPAEGLAEFAAGIMRESGPLNLAVSGGDTLLALITALDFEIIRPLGEIENGVVLSEIAQLPGRLVSKSGAFGKCETLMNIAAQMSAINPDL